MAKTYATKEQKRILEDAGVLHKKGRSKEDANNIIKILIEKKQVEKDILTRATEKQKSFLINKGVKIPSDLDKTEAAQMIFEVTSGLLIKENATKKQLNFMRELGIKPIFKITKGCASLMIGYLLSIRCARCNQIEYEETTNKKCRFCKTEIHRSLIKPSFFNEENFKILKNDYVYFEPIDEGLILFFDSVGFGRTEDINECDLKLDKTDNQIKIFDHLNLNNQIVKSRGDAKEIIDFIIKRTCFKCSEINLEKLDSQNCLSCNGYLKKYQSIPNYFRENSDNNIVTDENFIPATQMQINEIEKLGGTIEGNLSRDHGKELLEYLYKRKCRNCEHINLAKPLDSRSCEKCKTPLPKIKTIPTIVQKGAETKEEEDKELIDLLDQARKITTHPIRIFAEDTVKAIIGFFKKIFK